MNLDGPLIGPMIQLDRLHEDDADALRVVTRIEDFQYYLNLMPKSLDPADFTEFIREVARGRDRIPMVARTVASGEVVACSSWLDLRPEWRCLEIGMTWIAATWRGTWVNPSLKRMMLAQAFDEWDCLRVSLKCDARNLRSQAAIAKLGAQREGVLRSFGIQPSGYVRDTVMFSILREEWPMVREQLDRRIQSFASDGMALG